MRNGATYTLAQEEVLAMLRKRFAVVCVGTMAACSFAQVIVNPANGHGYAITPNLMTWQDAKAYAASRGGYLVTISDGAEQAWVQRTFQTQPQGLWIGLTDELSEGDWRWDNGEPLTFTLWADREPNNFPSSPAGEDYAYMSTDGPGRWVDAASPLYFGNPYLLRGVIEGVPLCDLPRFTTQPSPSQSAPLGEALFNVDAVADYPLSYQWRHNNNPLSDSERVSGSQAPTLTIAGVQSSDQGDYDCVVSGSCGTVTSAAAALSCMAAFTTQPIGGTFYAGLPIILVATHTPAGSATYRWKKNGANVFNSVNYSGATTPTLTINANDPSQSGGYSLWITNACGVATSDAAIVEVRCAGDFNGDGGMDGADVASFFAAWEGGELTADVNSDGGMDGTDVEAFFARWEAGNC